VVGLTPDGVDEVERAASPGKSGTEELASIKFQTGDVSNSVIQVGGGREASVSTSLPSVPDSGKSTGGRVGRVLSDSPRQVIVAVLAGLLVVAILALWATLRGGGTKGSTSGVIAAGGAGSSTTAAGVVFRFDDLKGGSSVIEVFPGVTSSHADQTHSGTYLGGQTAAAVCKTTGRPVISNTAVGERAKQSSVWVRIAGPGDRSFYATLTYGDIAQSALDALPQCQTVP
jgi:hypothetical protein